MHDVFFFFNDTATTEIYTLSLHDALPICLGARYPAPARERRRGPSAWSRRQRRRRRRRQRRQQEVGMVLGRSEEHTSELQSRQYLVCRLLLEKKKTSTK